MMREADIGDVVVTRPDGSVCGIVTDRDLALNVVAEGKDPTLDGGSRRLQSHGRVCRIE